MCSYQNNQSQFIDSLLKKGTGKVHFVGISGVGMAGLAFLFKSAGFEVSGCDLLTNKLSEWLADNGIEVLAGHSADHVSADIDCVVYSNAIGIDNIELLRAAELSIPLFSRGMVLPRFLNDCCSIAVSGTHGKTTTSTFIAILLKAVGLDPTWCIGGESDVLGSVAGRCNEGNVQQSISNNQHLTINAQCPNNILVVEADESDGTVAGYFPDVAVITNVEFDHMEHFADKNAFEDCFSSFIRQAKKVVLFCADDKGAFRLCESAGNGLSYGISDGCDIRAENIIEAVDGSVFDLVIGEKRYERINFSVSGHHNILNVLGAVAAISAVGVDLELIIPKLSELSLPKRRFERVVTQSGLQMISDYAHHPSEIAALVEMSRHIEAKRRIVVFQPHRYTRTKALGADFPAAFAGIDQVILLPVYAASEEPIDGGTHWDLYRHFIGAMKDEQLTSNIEHRTTENPDFKPREVLVAESCKQVWEYLKVSCAPDDLVMVVGAGDVIEVVRLAESYMGNKWQLPFGEWRVDKLERELKSTELRRNTLLAGKTTIKVGGRADLWAEVGSESDLLRLQAWAKEKACNMMVLGYGSNLVISDLGIRGVVVRLTGDFKGIREENGSLIVGAAVPAALLLTWMEKIGAGGLEFLEAIPASVGGMLRMNAGAYGDEIINHILWIRCLKNDGIMCTLEKDELNYEYRNCASLDNMIVLEACFRLEYGDSDASKAKRVAYAEKRRWMRGLRSCGSVFKNPAGDFAGRLIEEAGLKGKAIGGASVSELHANFIVTDYNATAADVMALIAYVHDEVLRCSGIDLIREVKYL